jgi:hypothetical protein
MSESIAWGSYSHKISHTLCKWCARAAAYCMADENNKIQSRNHMHGRQLPQRSAKQRQREKSVTVIFIGHCERFNITKKETSRERME